MAGAAAAPAAPAAVVSTLGLYSSNDSPHYLPKLLIIKTDADGKHHVRVARSVAAHLLTVGVGIDVTGGAVQTVPGKTHTVTIKLHHITGYMPDAKSTLTYQRLSNGVVTEQDWEAEVEPPSFVKEIVRLLAGASACTSLLVEISAHTSQMARFMAGVPLDTEREMFEQFGAVPADVARRIVVTQLSDAVKLMMMSLASQHNALAILDAKTTIQPRAAERLLPAHVLSPAAAKPSGATVVAAAAAASVSL